MNSGAFLRHSRMMNKLWPLAALVVGGCAEKGEWVDANVAAVPHGQALFVSGRGVGFCSVGSTDSKALEVTDYRNAIPHKMPMQDLRVGMKLRVRFTGQVADSYPGQIHAYEVRVVGNVDPSFHAPSFPTRP